MTTLVDKVVAVARALEAADIPFAFGGALALAYATEEPRGTRDIDVNVFVPASDAERTFAALPAGVSSGPADIEVAARDDQVRLWWGDTPVDVFFSAGSFHRGVAERVESVDFAGTTISVLGADDLAVFKVLFDRSKDWVDIEAMLDSCTLDLDEVIRSVRNLLGEDPRVERLRALRR